MINMGKIRKLIGSLIFGALWSFSLFAVYTYFKLLFSVELLTTAGIVGICLVPFILLGELFLSAFLLGGIKTSIEYW